MFVLFSFLLKYIYMNLCSLKFLPEWLYITKKWNDDMKKGVKKVLWWIDGKEFANFSTEIVTMLAIINYYCGGRIWSWNWLDKILYLIFTTYND